MSNIRESEVLHVEENTGRPIAISYDPGAFSDETVRTILNNQITSPTPLEIHCYVKGAFTIGGVFKTIEATDFIDAKGKNCEEKERFINSSLTLIKGLDTFDIIFSEPLKNK